MSTRKRSLLRLRQVVVVVLIIEAVLQLSYRVSHGSWLPRLRPFKVDHIIPQDDKRAYSYKPNFHDDSEGISIDQFGFRMSRKQPVPPSGSDVIVSLGDSVPFGHALR